MDNLVEDGSRQESIAFVKIFMAVFVPIIVCLMFFHLALYQVKKKHALQSLRNGAVQRATLLADTLGEHCDWVITDLNFMATTYLAASLDAAQPDMVPARIEKEFLLFSREKKMYDQIRIIDDQGREQLRINYNGGEAYAVPSHELQDKIQSYYFKECLALEPGNIYVSPLDLNVEHGEVEVPFKAVIRIGRPLLDGQGRKIGIILLNYYSDHLLKDVSAARASPSHAELMGSGSIMLVNTEGYWLVAADKEDAWGFMFAHRKGRTFAKRYPQEWQQMSTLKDGYLLTKGGYFIFATIQPPLASFGKIISFVSAERVRAIVYRERSTFYLLAFLFVALAALVSVLVAEMAVKKRRYEGELERTGVTDPLTGLLNRRAFQRRLELETGRADRYGGRLFMILGDIDHFKDINDTHGYDAGDFILKKLAGTLTANLRSTDVLCRWGGEEFMILVSGYTAEDGKKVAEKLRKAVEDEVVWFNNPRLAVTMSFGVCAYRKKMNMEELLKCSDEMLYTSKRNGRNQVTAE